MKHQKSIRNTDLELHEEASLILAAEECDPDRFSAIHRFSAHDERVIRKLIAHGPVLLQGGRGSGKSAFMIEASHRLSPHMQDSEVIGLYISLRYVPLLRASGSDYEKHFCSWVSRKIQSILDFGDSLFAEATEFRDLKAGLSRITTQTGKRIVLFFDDAAHIGRETSLSTFFDIFRTLSSDTISCKAAIYPGVTEFGARFDVYNDATVVDIVRTPEQSGFRDLFSEILSIRYPQFTSNRISGFSLEQFAVFIANAVLGNMRGFVFLCNAINEYNEETDKIGLHALGSTLLHLAADYYWPLLDEVRPKLGKYTPAVETAQEIAEILFRECASVEDCASVLVHRKIVARYSRPFEILEYVGFIARREASRAMRSGGRGTRYSVNLCNLLESTAGARLTKTLFEKWNNSDSRFAELHDKGEQFKNVAVPVPSEGTELGILSEPIEILKKSKAYPYGLTELKIDRLKTAGIGTIGDLAEASDDRLLRIESVGQVFVDRFRSAVAQAIWM